MCGTRRIGRLEIMVSVRQGGLLSGRIKRKLSNCPGFTLIELLVVIAIIALLMAILVPVLRSARNQARTVVCQANLKQWGQILNLYTQDNEGRLPVRPLHAFLIIFRRPFDTNYDCGISSYAGISAEGIACCPMATTGPGESASKSGWKFGREPDAPRGETMHGSTFGAWEITGWGSPVRGSYGFNGWFFTEAYLPNRGFPSVRGLKGLDTFSVRGSANIPAFLDATWFESFPISKSYPPPYERHMEDFEMGHYCINRHNGYTNCLFLDWSIRKIGLKELWTLKWESQFNTADKWTRASGVDPENWPDWMRNFKDY